VTDQHEPSQEKKKIDRIVLGILGVPGLQIAVGNGCNSKVPEF
jgi:hypothetical protein